jgi:flavin-dependent dehydrogenase
MYPSPAVVVLGAGPAGAVAAGLLAKAGRRVALIEERTCFVDKVGETLPAAAATALSAAGLQEVPRRIAALPSSGNCSLWGSDVLHTRHGLMSPYGRGLHLDRSAFDASLVDYAITAGAEFLPGWRLAAKSHDGENWSLKFASATRSLARKCEWVLDATGRRAGFARACGAKRVRFDKLVALVGVLETLSDEDEDLSTIVESSANGWWYTARIPLGRRVVMYFTDGDLLKRQGIKDSRTWLLLAGRTQLIRRFTGGFGYALSAPVRPTIADTSRLAGAAGPGWTAVGDSAAALDPLSSAGIMHAIKSAVIVANLLAGEQSDLEEGMSDYVRGSADAHVRNNALRCQYYRLEKRWPQSLFWRRRHEIVLPD